jgi:hypothetical protein
MNSSKSLLTPLLLLCTSWAFTACDSVTAINLGTPTPNPTASATPTTTPVVASFTFSPASGTVGSLVTLTSTNGADLSTTTAVSIGGVSSTPISVSPSTVVAIVMPGAATGPVAVTTSSTTFNSTSNFTLTTAGVIANQQGGKNVASDATTAPRLSVSSAVSADGNTAIFGGYADNSHVGAAWVFTRTSGVWSQQGSKLTGAGSGTNSYFGMSVGISGDGNTAVVGGYYDTSGTGAAWFFSRTNGVWSAQGGKIVPSDILGVSGHAEFGSGAAMSLDGNTAIIGGFYDNTGVGAAWIYKQTAGVWSESAKLIASDSTGAASIGYAVGLSADNTTAYMSGYNDNSGIGAMWVFTYANGAWTQQGSKIVPSDMTGNAHLGQGGGISLDGNTLVSGGPADNSSIGATWVFTRSAGVWSQQGTKLIGSGAVGAAYQGRQSAISGDGNTIITGGYMDNSNIGATWVFTRSGTTWTQQGTKLVGTGSVGSPVEGLSVCLSKDGQTAIVGGDSDNANNGAFWVFTP